MTTLRIMKPGMLTTVQDGGRPGHQHIGVTVGGAMDPRAIRTANILVGNARDAAALEVTLLGPTIEFDGDAVIALAGGDLDPRIDHAPVPMGAPLLVREGSRLSFGHRRSGCRAYISFAGGVDVPVVLGGRGTDITAKFGGHDGRPLRAGDVLKIGAPSGLSAAIQGVIRSSPELAAGFDPVDSEAGHRLPPSVRILPGPEYDLLTAASRDALFSEEFAVSPDSNRMGYRLSGPRLTLGGAVEMRSSPVALGVIQLPRGGDPILLMADRQTTGGYPRVAAAITPDIPILAQLAPGDRLTFVETTLDAAIQALHQQEPMLRELESRVLSFAGG
jgi:antagonist of KipI